MLGKQNWGKEGEERGFAFGPLPFLGEVSEPMSHPWVPFSFGSREATQVGQTGSEQRGLGDHSDLEGALHTELRQTVYYYYYF